MLLLNIYINCAWIITLISIQCLAQRPKESVAKSYATSVIGMVKLLEIDSQLIDNLNNYATELSEKLQILNNSIRKMRLLNDNAQRDQIQYLSNPLNAFSLIRRLQSDWNEWRILMERPVGKAQMKFYDNLQNELPTKLDLDEACSGFQRIQSTYDLKIKDMVRGQLNGKQYNANLNIFDVYAMGKYFFEEKNYETAIEWLNESLNLIQNNTISSTPITFDQLDLFQLIAETYVKLKNYSQALIILNMGLVDHKYNAKLLRLRKDVINCLNNTTIEEKAQASKKLNDNKILCNGQFIKKISNLHCLYNTTTKPFLHLAPFKMEILSMSPYIVLFHDVISLQEIDKLQKAITPKLRRAETYNFGKNKVSKDRTTNYYYFNRPSELTLRIVRRINHMTGFNLYNSDNLNVMNYGIGGHYSVHYDYFDINKILSATQTSAATKKELTSKGDRIATMLFYLSDVDQGGATVFPRIQEAIFPKRGTALFWYNLHHDGQIDPRTLHAACPVIVGSKWVMTMWIREREQIFKRPCQKL